MSLRATTEEIALVEEELRTYAHDWPPKSLRQRLLNFLRPGRLTTRRAALLAEQEAQLVGAIIQIGAEDNARPDRPRATRPPLGRMVRLD